MSAAATKELYNFIISACTDERGVEASFVLGAVSGAAGFSILESYLPLLEGEVIAPGTSLLIEDVDSDLEKIYGELLRYAANMGIDPDPNSGWIGAPLEADPLKEYILSFNHAHYSKLKELYESSDGDAGLFRSTLLGLCCFLLQQVGGTIIPQEEGKKILVWGLQCGCKTMPL